MTKQKLNIILLAAGKGTRMKSELPKVLHKVCGQSLLERSHRAVSGLRPEKVVIVVGHEKELVEDEISKIKEISPESCEIISAFQKEQKGTGDAARVGLEFCEQDSQILILPADVPLLRTETLTSILESKVDLSLLSFEAENPGGFGRIIRDEKGLVKKIVEEKDASPEEKRLTEVNASIYLIKAPLLKDAVASLSTENAQGEYYLTDIVHYANIKNLRVDAIKVTSSAELQGANTIEELSKLEAKRRKEINRRHMLAGVRFEDPERAYVDEDVKIAADCFIGSGTRLKGKTELENFVYLEGDTLIIDSKIAKNTRIKLGTRIEKAEIAEDCAVGPFAQLRPGTKLEKDVKVGNFVEVKNSHLKEGAKAGHLSYLGDAELGKDVNIGAGTITCNYDGVSKHKTKIEDDVFVGSNTAFVAPIKIGKGSTIGAGSVITKDVPEHSLSLERSVQKTIKDWAKKKRRD